MDKRIDKQQQQSSKFPGAAKSLYHNVWLPSGGKNNNNNNNNKPQDEPSAKDAPLQKSQKYTHIHTHRHANSQTKNSPYLESSWDNPCARPWRHVRTRRYDPPHLRRTSWTWCPTSSSDMKKTTPPRQRQRQGVEMAMRSSLPPRSVPARCHSSWQRDRFHRLHLR